MNQDTRALYATGIFDSFTHSITQILPPVPKAKGKNNPPPTDPIATVRASLAEFRKSFDGRTWGKLDEAGIIALWTPDEVARVFGHLNPVIAELGKIVPALAAVESPVANLPASAIPDGCAALDALLTALASYIVQVRFHYWAQYRKNLAQGAAAEAAQVTVASGYLASEIQAFCRHARRASKENDEIFGALVEEFIRKKVAAAVHPLEVSSGGIGGLGHMAQLDCIIWERRAGLPAIEIGNVAIVSPVAARAVIEVKSCCDTTLADFSHRIMRLHAEGSVLQDIYTKAFYAQAVGIVVWTDFLPARFVTIAGNTVLPLFYRTDGNLAVNQAGFEALFEFLNRWGRAA